MISPRWFDIDNNNEIHNIWEISSNFCGLLRKPELQRNYRKKQIGVKFIIESCSKMSKIKTLKFSHFCFLFIPQFQKVLYKFSLIMFLFLAAKCTTSRKVRFCEHDSHSVIPTSTTDWWVSSTPFDFSQILAIRG